MTDDEIDAYIDAASKAVSLAIDPSHKAGVAMYFGIAEKFAQVIDAVDLTPHDESAVVFTPLSTPVFKSTGE